MDTSLEIMSNEYKTVELQKVNNNTKEQDEKMEAEDDKQENKNEEIIEKKDSELVITKEMLEEEKNIEKENKRAEQALLKEEEKKKIQKEALEQRHKRLMHLLNKSKFYSDFLMNKIKGQQLNLKGRKEDKENYEKCSQQSHSSSQGSGESRSHKKRGKKRKRGKDTMLKETINEQELDQNLKATKSMKEEEPSLKESHPLFFENGIMRPYQLEGFSWLKIMYENGVNGILADEMGLGKTVQCIALICHLVAMKVPGPFLVVAPLSTLPNWLAEFKRFAPMIPTVLYHGSETVRNEKRKEMLRKNQIHCIDLDSEVCPVVITSYEVSIRDSKKLNKILWRYIVVDEGHRLKNYKCHLARTLRTYHTTNSLLLTGTPLQNDLSELWSLLNFLLPEIFDSLEVFESWFDIDDLMTEESNARIVQQEQEKQIVATLHKILSPFLLRRVKADVDLQIPGKKELLVYSPLTEYQLKLYTATITRDLSALAEMNIIKKEEVVTYDTKERPIRKCSQGKDFSYVFNDSNSEAALDNFVKMAVNNEGIKNTKEVIEASPKHSVVNLKLQNIMMQCRKAVNHPYLIRYPLTPEGEYKVDEDLVKASGKLIVLDQILAELHKRNHKVLLFSQMTQLLNIIEDYLTLRPQYRYKRLDGSITLDKRGQDIDEFNSSDKYFLYLLSTRAGGLGVNLTSADTVVIYDSDWNPQADLQAQDRCHRIGQTKPVLILRFVTASTIDQRVVEKAATKRKLEKLIIQSGRFKNDKNRQNSNMSHSELLALLEKRDHDRIHKTTTGNVFTKEELDKLLDRSDLIRNNNNNMKLSKIETEKKLDGVFKSISTSD